ncbi:MAG TPA: mitochondrial fission ELM1 family protein [Candidatus Competibacteraceae bacterium]|nr:mitochondrial fission ELM1 family protein [Candidatus Competibacteraceae bacterium]HSA48243.1 mitochondrial fission ELM1 family protein [Candidatus Competibacteraceae bacterium]
MRPLVVWRFSDGKAGHDGQSRGLLEALSRLRPVEALMLDPLPTLTALSILFIGRFLAWRHLPIPDIVLGAGHRTHLSLLAARRVHRGKAVVLMRPSLPLSLFDLCLIPEHDAPPARRNVLATRGALNRIQPSTALEPSRGLLLIGGPSAHFAWDNESLHRQIAAIVAADPAIHWTLTTSRRTPANFLEYLSPLPPAPSYDGEGELPKTPSPLLGEGWGGECERSFLKIVPVVETGPDWLPAQLARTGQVWVTADSVSMVYEALTAGAAVGVLDVPVKHANRVSQGLAQLATEGWVTPFADGSPGQPLQRPPQTFNEAERCARWIIEQWFA